MLKYLQKNVVFLVLIHIIMWSSWAQAQDIVLSEPSLTSEEEEASEEEFVSGLLSYELDTTDVSPQDLGMSLFRVSTSFVIVIAIIGVCFYVFRLLQNRKTHDPRGGRIMHVLERLYLGPKRSIVLVRVGNKALALGIDDQIRVLATLEDEENLKILDSEEYRKKRRFGRALNVSETELKEQLSSSNTGGV